MFAACCAFTAMQAVVKLARQGGMDPTEVMFYRTAPGLPLLWWILRRRGQGLWPDRPASLAVRSLFGSVAMSTNFTSMLWLSLAQFSTLNLMQPVFVALSSPLILGERIRKTTWVALLFASAGAFVMLFPALEARHIPPFAAVLGIVSALASAFAHIWVKKATETDPAERVVFHFAAWVSIASLAVGLLRGHFSGLPADMDRMHMVWLVLGMSAFGTLGQVLMTRAHVFGDAAVVALVGYSSVGLSMGLDVALFDATLVSTVFVGAGLMLIAGLLLVRGANKGQLG
jgi:drug/metabolite transporter (DMT)-like permease